MTNFSSGSKAKRQAFARPPEASETARGVRFSAFGIMILGLEGLGLQGLSLGNQGWVFEMRCRLEWLEGCLQKIQRAYRG